MRTEHRLNEMTYILTWSYNLDTNKIKYIIHLDQKASQADIYKE